jgi:N-acetylglucosaminyldiphosphoundecaprenol N-acetyl-beta-D-mannosaminyltransferase
MSDPLVSIDILGVRVHPLTVLELHGYLAQAIHENTKNLVLNVNVHCLNLALEQPWLRDFLNRAEVVFCDGAGVILGARILGHHIPERITYADWFWQLADFSNRHHFSLYFLGASPGVAARTAERLREHYPALEIAGVQHGYFDKTPGSEENEGVIAAINAIKPNILVLGMGMPLQERWLYENWDRIDANIALTGGAVFDYLSGELQRAPRWMTEHSLEWLGRLLIEPNRLWKRYLLGNPRFLWNIYKQKLGF